MLYRPLGRTGLSVSEIGFGCASWWGQQAFSERDAQALVEAALAGGVTLFDTAPGYSGGQAEPRLGRALKGRDVSGLVISTKAGTRFDKGRIVRDMSPQAIRVSVSRSLERLGLDRIQLLQLHGPSVAELQPDLLEPLADLKRQDLVTAIGVTSFDPAVIDHAIGQAQIDAVMIDYNVLRPERGPLIARAAAAGKGVLAGMPLAMGHTGGQLLKLRSLRDAWYAARALKNHRAEIAAGARFGFLHRRADMTGAQAALAYVLANRDVAAAVVGVTRMSHLRDNLAASGMALPADLADAIRAAQAVHPN